MQGLSIYKSSAGSGKTYTLVQEYLKLVLVNPFHYRQVLAVTFTNKATREMKDRIVKTLSQLATLSDQEVATSFQYQQLSKFLKDKGKEHIDVRKQAQEVLNLILNDYSNFSVSTIESFFQRIVRAFARELDIPLTYDIELRELLVLDHLIGDLLLEMGDDRDLTKLFQRFIDRNLMEERSWHVDVEVKQLGRQIFQEKFQRLVNEFPEAGNRIEKTLSLARDLLKIRSSFVKVMESYATSALELIQEYGLSIEDFKYGKASVPNYFRRILNKQEYKPSKRAEKGIEDDTLWYTAKSEQKDQIEAAMSAGLVHLLKETLDYYEKHIIGYQTAIQVLRSIYSFGVLSDLQRRLADYRRENSQMLISDTGFLLNRVVRASYDAPFIYEKVGTNYIHYLLDEFQDTSDMQWDSLWPLVGDALASGNGSLIVGDVKQSIYRWRNGNMQLLLNKVEHQVNQQGQNAVVNHLDSNWRTAEEVVAFNNDFFRQALDILKEKGPAHEEVLELAYQSLEQTPQKTHIPGRVEISFFNEDDALSWQEQAEKRLIELIRELTGKGADGSGPRYDEREITLLVRKNSEGMRLASILQEQQIKVASAESLLVDKHLTVRFLHAILQHLNHEEDPIVLASLRFFYSRLSAEANLESEDTHALFTQRELVELMPTLAASKDRLRQLAVYECLEQVISLFPFLEEPSAYIQGFMDAALEYSSSYDASISGFLDWWEEQRGRRAIAASPVKEAVQIMTVHKSKGLEFPVVILPYANWTLEPERRDILWAKTEDLNAPYDTFPFLPISPSSKLTETHFAFLYEEEQLQSVLDNLNLLYVAMTRPQHRLYLLTEGAKPSRNLKMSTVSHLIQQTLCKMEAGFEATGGSTFIRGPQAIIEKEEEEDLADSKDLTRNDSRLSNWNQAIRIKYSSNRYLNTDILTRTDKISEGTLLHETLAFVETAQDIPAAIERAIRNGLLSHAMVEEIEARLREAVNHLSAVDWFSGNWEVKNEAEIISTGGEVLRPDRVMIQGTQAIVVDYKTGTPNKRYDKQILVYADALKRLGYAPVHGYVYYLSMRQVVQVV